MVLAEFLALIAAAVPVQPAAADKPDVTTYDAIVATEETLTTKDLVKPAVFIGEEGKSLIVAAPDSRSIA